MKRGFTLIELMAVIFILGIIGVIAVVAVDKLIKDNKESMYNVQISNIEDAARTWGNAHINLLPDGYEEGAISVPLLVLKRDGLLDKDYTNPKTGELFYDNMYIDITYNGGTYDYKVIEDSGTENYLDTNGEVDLSYPAIILKERFNYESIPTSSEVYIVSLDKNISTKTLITTNDSTNGTSTLTYEESSKTFTVVRKAKTA